MPRLDPDEGPSPADLRRFGEERIATGFCPDCGAEVIDDADICPRCFAFLDGATLARRAKRRGYFHEHWKRLLIIALIAAMLLGGGAAALFGAFRK